MKKYILTLLLIFNFINFASADTAVKFEDYGETSEVNFTNLNGNIDNLIRILNGGLTGVNPKTGFNFIEVLSALPIAGQQGRIVYNTTDDTFNADNGTAFVTSPTYPGTAAQGDVLYFDGTNWTLLTAGTVGNTLKTFGTGANPAWVSLDLGGGAAFVFNQLPVANGGTGQDFSSVAQGEIIYFSATGTMASLGVGTDGQFLKTQGAAANPEWATGTGVPTNIQAFTSSGTWDWDADQPDVVWVKVWGGGGEGAQAAGAGAGGGGYSEGLVSVTGDVTVTIGAGGTGGSTEGNDGGDSTFVGGTTLTGGGGKGGDENPDVGGAGGVGSGGTINLTGQPGGGGDDQVPILPIGGDAAGGGGAGSYQTGVVGGVPGGGSAKHATDAGNGGAGLVIVYY